MAEDCVAVVAGIPDTHPDRLLYPFCSPLRPRVLQLPVGLVEIDIVLLEDGLGPFETPVNISLHWRSLVNARSFSRVDGNYVLFFRFGSAAGQ
jgi:hypothetical protein